jgi:photosystem II stability/assembly factor-like uncharacterized protein
MRRIGWLFALIALALCGLAHAQWESENSGTTADLRGISNVGGGVAWASGTNGTVLRTEDGGYLWQACSVPPGAEHLDFRGIQAFDSNTAIVMSSGKGDLSRLYKTTDGCHTWKLVFTDPDRDGFWDAIQFPGQRLGWILGDPTHGRFQLWKTDTGGKGWRREAESAVLKADPKSAGAFAASNSSLSLCPPNSVYPVFGSGGVSGAFFYRIIEISVCVDCSDQLKDHWERDTTPIAGGVESAGIFSISMRDATRGVVVGGNYLKPDDASGTAAFTNDAGKTWIASQTPPHGYRSAVAYDPASKTWITVGPNGTDISTDDGKNWRALHPDPALHEPPDADRNWNALSLPFVVGPHGRIGKLRATALARASNERLPPQSDP